MRTVIFVSALFLILAVAGCRVTERAEVEGIKAGWDVIGPRYVSYLRADQSLVPDIRADREKTAEELGKAIERLAAKARG